jgi:DNA-binding transcriptional LysR family regulator
MLIPQAIALFRNRHPDVKLTFHCLNYGYLKDRLLARQADLGIIILPMEHPSLQVTPLCSNRLVCVLPYNHELTRRGTLSLADLRPFPLISYNRDSPFGGIVGRFYQSEEEPLRPIMEVGSPQNACSLVQAGAGIALVDEFSVRSWPTHELIMRPVLNAPVLQANLVHSRFEPMSKLAQAFVRVLRDQMQRQGFEPLDEKSAQRAAETA